MGDGRGDHVEQVAPVRAGMDGPGLDPGEVEQVADQPGEAIRLLLDRVDQGDPILGGRSLLPQARSRGADGGQRRAQVVGDGVEDHRLGRIRLPGRLGLGAARGGGLPLGGDIEQSRERRGDPVEVRLGPVRRSGGVEPDGASIGGQAQADLTLLGPRRGAGTQPQLSAPRRLQTGGDRHHHVVRPAEQRGRGIGEHHRLALPRSGLLGAQLGLGGLPPNLSGEAPDHQRREQQHPKRHDVVRVGDRQLVERLDEEVVEGEDAEYSGGEGGDLAATDRDGQNCDQIDAAEPGRRGDRVEDRDHSGGQTHPGQGLQSRGGDAAEVGPRTHSIHLDPSLGMAGAANAGPAPRLHARIRASVRAPRCATPRPAASPHGGPRAASPAGR